MAYCYQGRKVLEADDDSEVRHGIEPGVYKFKNVHPGEGVDVVLELQEDAKFELPKTLYGNVLEEVDNIFAMKKQRNKSMGVLAKGFPGTGKTMIAKAVIVRALKEKTPVILIDDGQYAKEMFDLLDSDITNAVVVIDEIEKAFTTEDEKKALLTFLDGVERRNYLTIATANNVEEFGDVLLDRPGRFAKVMQYWYLKPHEIKEVCEMFLGDKKKAQKLADVMKDYRNISIDKLNAVTLEIKRKPKLSYKKVVESLGFEPVWFAERKYPMNKSPKNPLKLLFRQVKSDNSTEYLDITEEVFKDHNVGIIWFSVEDLIARIADKDELDSYSPNVHLLSAIRPIEHRNFIMNYITHFTLPKSKHDVLELTRNYIKLKVSIHCKGDDPGHPDRRDINLEASGILTVARGDLI